MIASHLTTFRPTSRATSLRLLAALGAGTVLLTACGSGEGSVSTSAAASPAASAAAESAPATAPAGACATTATAISAPAGSTTDLKTKPVIKGSTTPAPTALEVADLVKGTGAEAVIGSQVEVKYVGVIYESGQEFDSSWQVSPEQTIPFEICGAGVIDGFAVGPLGMKVGGRRQIVIPAKFGYGDAAQGASIPANSTLVFVVDLTKVTPPA